MSQKKVDKYKEEKKNRAKKLKKKRVREYALVIIGFAALGAAIGYPFGRFLYRQNYNKRKANAKVEAAQFDYWFNKEWQANISGTLGYEVTFEDATASDATSTDSDTQ